MIEQPTTSRRKLLAGATAISAAAVAAPVASAAAETPTASVRNTFDWAAATNEEVMADINGLLSLGFSYEYDLLLIVPTPYFFHLTRPLTPKRDGASLRDYILSENIYTQATGKRFEIWTGGPFGVLHPAFLVINRLDQEGVWPT